MYFYDKLEAVFLILPIGILRAKIAQEDSVLYYFMGIHVEAGLVLAQGFESN